MNILILGDGPTEYRFAKKIEPLQVIKTIFVAPGNAQTALLNKTQNLNIKTKDTQAIAAIIAEYDISLCVHDAENSDALFDALQTIPKLTNQSKTCHHQPLSYARSGVSIDEGNALINHIKPLVKKTYRKETVSSLGGFSGAFRLPQNYTSPLLVAATDGVGTKLKIATSLKQHHNIGIDLVAMCVNDLIVCGAEPLFFLDYYATSKLDNEVAREVIEGICEGCIQAGCSLIGGETAEMPGIYQEDDYDLAGFSVGIVEQHAVIDGKSIQTGDVVIGLHSSGIHSNGYSLVRAIIEQKNIDLQQTITEKTLAQWLLTPTKIYVKDIVTLKQHLPKGAIKGLAHITGGGLVENIPRILPKHVCVEIDAMSWQAPAIFPWLQQQGRIEMDEMWRVFNMGIGMVIIISPHDCPSLLKHFGEHNATKIGTVKTRQGSSAQCLITGNPML